MRLKGAVLVGKRKGSAWALGSCSPFLHPPSSSSLLGCSLASPFSSETGGWRLALGYKGKALSAFPNPGSLGGSFNASALAAMLDFCGWRCCFPVTVTLHKFPNPSLLSTPALSQKGCAPSYAKEKRARLAQATQDGPIAKALVNPSSQEEANDALLALYR